MNRPQSNLSGSQRRTEHASFRMFIGRVCLIYLGSLVAFSSTVHGQFGGGQSSQGDGTNARSSQRAKNPKLIQVILREGTRVGPIRGRFVLRGQRWMFLVDGGRSDPTNVSEMIDGGVARKVTPQTGSVLGRNRASDGLANTEVPSFANDSIGRANPSEVQRPPSLRLNAFDQMIVLENLMLGRIANAIEQDPDDDVWNITARVTEFDDQNRLLLITAHRASASR